MGKTSEAQIRASKKWDDAHRDKKRYIREKSAAKNFIIKKASQEDLVFLADLIFERLNNDSDISDFHLKK